MTMLDPRALEFLKNNQRQLDMDGCEVGVSRQALDELIAAYEALSTIAPAEVGGLLAELRDEDFRHEMQHLRSSSEIDRLFQAAASLIQSQAARELALEDGLRNALAAGLPDVVADHARMLLNKEAAPHTEPNRKNSRRDDWHLEYYIAGAQDGLSKIPVGALSRIATAITAKDAEMEGWKRTATEYASELHSLRSQLAEARKALEPFALVTILPTGEVVGMDRRWFDAARRALGGKKDG